MSKKILTFDGSNEDHKRIYTAIHLAIRFGRATEQKAPGKAVLRRERDIRKSIEAIGVADPEKSGDLKCPGCSRVVMEKDTPARILRPEGGTITWSPEEVELITERIDKGAWTGDMSIDLADALDFLTMAPEPGPKPIVHEDSHAG